MTLKSVLAIVAGLLGIVCGEALKLGLTNWHDLGSLTYWLGVGVQTASLLGVYAGGLYQPQPGKPNA